MSTVKIGLKRIEKWNTSLEREVLRYEAEPIQKGGILFYGDSDFTRWSERFGVTDISEVIVGKSGTKCAINRGFGSSSPEHQLYYYPRMVRPLEPSVLVISAGFGNGASFGYTADEMLFLLERLVAYARADFPDIHIYFYGESRRRHAANPTRLACINGARELMERTPNCHFLDSTDFEPLNVDGLIGDDKIHFNEKGYSAFGEFFKIGLREELERF